MVDNSPSGKSPEQPETLGQKAKSLLGVILKRPVAPPPPLETAAAPDEAAASESAPAADPDPIPSADSTQPSEPAATEPTADGDSSQDQVPPQQDPYWTGLEKLKAASPAHIPGGGRFCESGERGQ